MSDRDYIAFIEACYRVEQSEGEWLRGVAEAAAALMGFGEGVHAYFVDVEGARITSPILVDGRPEWEAAWQKDWWDAFMAPLQSDDLRLLHRMSSVSYTSELWGAVADRSTTFADYLTRVPRPTSDVRSRYLAGKTDAVRFASGFRYPDSFNVGAIDATGRGAAFIANMPEAAGGSVSPQEQGLWSRLGAHAAAGLRILRKLESVSGELGGVDAVVAPDGKVQHIAREIRGDAAVGALRERVVAVDRARAHQRHDPRAATEAWVALTEGRWSLIDRFDRDGRRFYLARANMPMPERTGRSPTAMTALTEREEQVACAAALGHSNKHIAYELGIALSTVATHLKSAAEKLGVASRLDLIRAMRARS